MALDYLVHTHGSKAKQKGGMEQACLHEPTYKTVQGWLEFGGWTIVVLWSWVPDCWNAAILHHLTYHSRAVQERWFLVSLWCFWGPFTWCNGINRSVLAIHCQWMAEKTVTLKHFDKLPFIRIGLTDTFQPVSKSPTPIPQKEVPLGSIAITTF